VNLRFTLKLKSAAILGKASVRELRPLGFTGSAAFAPALFVGFAATMTESDFSLSWGDSHPLLLAGLRHTETRPTPDSLLELLRRPWHGSGRRPKVRMDRTRSAPGRLSADAKSSLRDAVALAYLDGEHDLARSHAATAWVVKGKVP
jgi:hypothetical protein